MEKILNLLKPGASKDDETLYGSGEGSHLESSTNPNPSSGVTTTTTTQTHSQTGTSHPPRDAVIGAQEAINKHGLHGEQATSGLGSTQNTGLTSGTSQQHGERGLPMRGVDSGIGKSQNTGLTSSTSGPHSSNLANRVDPTVDSNKNTQNPSFASGPGGALYSNPTAHSDQNNQKPSFASGPSGILSSHSANDSSAHSTQSQSSTTHRSGLGNAQIGGESIGQSAFSGVTGDSRNAQTAGQVTPGQDIPGGWIDDSAPSHQYGSGVTGNNTSSGSHLGRDAAAVGTAGAIGSKLHSDHEHERNLGSNATTSRTAQEPPLSSTTGISHRENTTSESHLGRDAAVGGTAGTITSNIHNERGSGTNTGSSGLSQASHFGSNTGASQGTQPSSGSHLGRDSVIGGATGTLGSGVHNERGIGADSNSGLGQGSHVGSNTGVSQGASSSTGSHLGRDAALGGTAAAIGSGIHTQHDNERNSGPARLSSALGGQGPVFTGATQRSGGSQGTGGSQGLGSSQALGGSQGASTTGGSHLGRDTAIGAGVLGSGAQSHHESARNPESAHLSSALGGQGPVHTGASHGTSSSHESHLGRDSAIGAGILGSGSQTHHESTRNPESANLSSALGGQGPVHTGASQGANRSHESHLNRDSTIGAGVLGSGTHGRHEDDRNPGLATGSTGIGHGSQSQVTSSSSGHHFGRDAAILGTGAAVGSGIHSHRDNEPSLVSTSGLAGSNSGATHFPGSQGPHATTTANLLDPSVNTNATTPLESAHEHHPIHGGGAEEADHEHHGRNAALGAGGVGALGLAAHEHGSHSTERGTGIGSGVSNSQSTGPAPNTKGPHPKDYQNVLDPRVNPNNAATLGSSQTGSPNTTDNSGHHLGRDATLGAGAVGAAGLAGGAAHETDKHHEKELTKAQHEAEKKREHDLKEAEKQHKKDAEKHEKKEKKGGFLSFLHRDKSKKYTAEEEADFDRQEREHNASQSHAGRNTALGGAAVGAAGVGAYEANQHHDADTNKSLPTAPGNHGFGTGAGTQNALAGNSSGTEYASTNKTPLDHKPVGKDIGDHLHGDRNRGVKGSSGYAGTSGFADGTTGRDHGGPFHDHTNDHHRTSEAKTGQHGQSLGSGSTAGTGYGNSGSQQTSREFPLGGTGTGHQQSGISSSQHQTSSSDTSYRGQSGLTGHNTQPSGQEGYQSVLDPGPKSVYSPGSSADQQSDTSGIKTSDLSGRNRLHKDPPADHPAAHAYPGEGYGGEERRQ